MLSNDPLASSPLASSPLLSTIDMESTISIFVIEPQASMTVAMGLSSDIFSVFETPPSELTITNPNWIFSDISLSFSVSPTNLGIILDLENLNVNMAFSTTPILNNANFLPTFIGIVSNFAPTELLIDSGLKSDITMSLNLSSSMQGDKPISANIPLLMTTNSSINIPIPIETSIELTTSVDPVTLQIDFQLGNISTEMSFVVTSEMEVTRQIYLHTPGYDGVLDVDVDIPGSFMDVNARLSVQIPLLLEPFGGFGFDIFGDIFDLDPMAFPPVILSGATIVGSLHVDRALGGVPISSEMTVSSSMETKFFGATIGIMMNVDDQPLSLSVDSSLASNTLLGLDVIGDMSVSSKIAMFSDLDMKSSVTGRMSVGIPLVAQVGVAMSSQPIKLAMVVPLDVVVPMSVGVIVGDLHNKSILSTLNIDMVVGGDLSVGLGLDANISSVLSVSGVLGISREVHLHTESVKNSVVVMESVLSLDRGISANIIPLTMVVGVEKLHKNIDISTAFGMSIGVGNVDLFVSHGISLTTDVTMESVVEPIPQINMNVGLRGQITGGFVVSLNTGLVIDKQLNTNIPVTMSVSAFMLTQLYGVNGVIHHHPTGNVKTVSVEDRTLVVRNEN